MGTNYEYKLRNRIGKNPFTDSQARTYSEEQAIGEFFATSIFWNIFNSQNEIYLGTRGSGKTILMRMASYKLLRKMQDERAKNIIRKREHICFFIPLNLEFATSIISRNKNNEYFLFSVNCLSIEAFIDTLMFVIEDLCSSNLKRNEMNIRITAEINNELKICEDCTLLNDIRRNIAKIYNNVRPWNDGEISEVNTILYKEFLTPILRIIDILNRIYENEFKSTTWIACIDEAEFLQESHLKCVNAFMRTTKKNLALKMTTLPTKHLTKETNIKGIQIDENGNDFNYRWIDYNCDSVEYVKLTNYIVKHRLENSEHKISSLEELLGTCGKNDDQLDYFISALGVNEIDGKRYIKQELVNELSPQKRLHFESIKNDQEKASTQYIEKYSPAFYIRYAKRQNIANRTFEWFIGSRTIRKMSDGNPRRFIEIMNYVVNEMMSKDITKKELHNIIIQFAMEEEKRIQSLPEYGFLLREICNQIGEIISKKIHGEYINDYGCNFYIDKNLLENIHIDNAIKLGIDYNHIKLVKNKYEIIDSETHLRLSYLHAVVHWIPMRVVDHPTPIIRPNNLIFQFEDVSFNNTNAKKLISNYDLEIKNDF